MFPYMGCFGILVALMNFSSNTTTCQIVFSDICLSVPTQMVDRILNCYSIPFRKAIDSSSVVDALLNMSKFEDCLEVIDHEMPQF